MKQFEELKKSIIKNVLHDDRIDGFAKQKFAVLINDLMPKAKQLEWHELYTGCNLEYETVYSLIKFRIKYYADDKYTLLISNYIPYCTDEDQTLFTFQECKDIAQNEYNKVILEQLT